MEDFVSFEIAKKLKEKGFRELSLAYYTNDDRLWFNHSHKAGATYSDCYISHNLMPKGSVSGKFVDAPAISQVLKWLREEKNINICIDIYDDGWFFDIASFYKEDTGVYEIKLPYKSSNVTPDYDTYEQAALAGIEYVLDNLI